MHHVPILIVSTEPNQCRLRCFILCWICHICCNRRYKIILCKGIYGTQRIARHLWRMCLGFFIAAGSLFIGNPQVFSEYFQQAEVLAIPVLTFPVLAILVLTVFWLVKVLFFSRRVKAK
jgi:hypothetical protein